MLPEFREYLQEIKFHLRLEPKTTEHIIDELHSHIQDKYIDLRLNGLSEKEAANLAVQSFGRANEIAQLMYESFARGSWSDASMVAMPHLTVACLFALHLWRNLFISAAFALLVVIVSIIGLHKGRPNWVYSWLSYVLLFLIVIAYLTASTVRHWVVNPMESRQGPWFLFLSSALFLLALAGLLWAIYRVIKWDWILASFMMLPLPAAVCWMLALQPFGYLIKGASSAPLQIDSPVATTALILGTASLLFIRQRTREAKIVILLSAGTISLPLIAHKLWGSLGPLILVCFAFVAILLIFIPKRVETIIGHDYL